MKHWRIIFYLGDQLYDVMDVFRSKRPVRYAQTMLGIATRFEIVLIG